jgi:hypothetical protein
MGQLISKEIEYNFSDESCFENIRALLRECGQFADIIHMRHILVKNECIQYKYVSVLLRNILILLGKPVPYTFLRKTKKIERREAMGVYKSFYEIYFYLNLFLSFKQTQLYACASLGLRHLFGQHQSLNHYLAHRLCRYCHLFVFWRAPLASSPLDHCFLF